MSGEIANTTAIDGLKDGTLSYLFRGNDTRQNSPCNSSKLGINPMCLAIRSGDQGLQAFMQDSYGEWYFTYFRNYDRNMGAYDYLETLGIRPPPLNKQGL